MIKIHFYKPNSLMGRIITWVTKSDYSHVSIEIDNINYDSSESKGFFGISDINPLTRQYITYEISGDLSEWLNLTLLKEYDWVGVLGWLFNIHDKSKFYCFESVQSALIYLGHIDKPIDKVNANDLIEILEKVKN